MFRSSVLNTNNKITLSTQSKLKTPKNTNLKPKSTLTWRKDFWHLMNSSNLPASKVLHWLFKIFDGWEDLINTKKNLKICKGKWSTMFQSTLIENSVLYFSTAGQLFQAKSSQCTETHCEILQMSIISNETKIMATIKNSYDLVIDHDNLVPNCCQFVT